jgi:excisionase family DNA binding protein
MTNLGKSTIYRWRSEGKFPQSVKLGSKTVWKKDDVDQWMQQTDLSKNWLSV